MTGHTILLLDDEPLILMDLEFAVEDIGSRALSAGSLVEAMKAIEREAIDCAVLDITLQDGDTCLPAARALERRGIPYLLHSGDFDRRGDTIGQLEAPLIPKPAASARVIGEAIALARGKPSLPTGMASARGDAPRESCEG